ncbi:MAG: FAD/NAD(P)-binding protein [Leptolyngbya sp. Prado105]|jgi:uncharacterized NAD(P)/FAD-binding protein YdhS|nr:FAD/NAD(P)-binding protein [Leptolyngbya sp. Prado105]
MKTNTPHQIDSEFAYQEDVIEIAIVGSGARGLSILERIIAFARADQFRCPMMVKVFDRDIFGPGCHSIKQPEHLLVNTIASQITIFSDPTVQGSGFSLNGPSFYEWLCDHYSGLSPDPNAYYPRKYLGQYLAWSFDYLRQLAPATLRIITVSKYVVAASAIAQSASPTWKLTVESGDTHVVQYVFLTTGHEQETLTPEQCEQRLFPAYPLETAVSGIQPHETIAMEGLGLSACDVISMLTVGRGGKFVRDRSRHLCYQASGQEPTIIGFARSGLPITARAVNEKELREQYKAQFLTRDAIAQLKQQYGQLDFERQVLPLLLADMEFVYSKTYIQKHKGFTAAHDFANHYLTATEAQRQSIIAFEIPLDQRFNWSRLVQPIPQSSLSSHEQYKTWLHDYLHEDLSDANEGNLSNPLKAACDVLRDVRDNLRYVIDFGGLTETSHRWLVQTFLPIMNRLAVGPPKARLEEMLALQAVGILKLDIGPNPQCQFDQVRQRFVIQGRFEQVEADVLIRSRIAMPPPQASSNPLLRQLVGDGISRPFMNGQFHPGGLDVSRGLNLIDQMNVVYLNFWVLGTPIEGPKFYTFILPRPFVNSTALLDADRVVQALCDQLRCQQMRQSSQIQVLH